MGTPTEEHWEGCTHLKGYKEGRGKIFMYPHQKLGHVFPRLYDIAEGENLATSLLQVLNLYTLHYKHDNIYAGQNYFY